MSLKLYQNSKQFIDDYGSNLKNYLDENIEDKEIDFAHKALNFYGGYLYNLKHIDGARPLPFIENLHKDDHTTRRVYIDIKSIGNYYDDLSIAIDEYDGEFMIDMDREDVKSIIENYFHQSEKGISFQHKKYELHKKAYKNIIEWLEERLSLMATKNIEVDLKDLKRQIEPLDFNLNQTDVVHFFDLLVDAGVIEEPSKDVHKKNGGFYPKIAQYFTAKGKAINSKSAKSTKPNMNNKGTSYSESYFEMLKNLQSTINKKLDSKSLQ